MSNKRKSAIKHEKKLKFSPTLNTILMVEEVLKNNADGILKISELKRSLPKQINHNMLKIILQYLEDNRKIYVGLKGIMWVENPSQKMQQALRNSYRYPDDFPK